MFGLIIVIYFILALILARGAKLLEHHVNRRVGRDVARVSGGAHSPVPEWALGGGV